VYLAWIAVTSVGGVGVILLRLRLRLVGLLLIAGYALLGFAGLDHYWVAPFAAHSLAMNATIGFEVASAAVLLLATFLLLFRTVRRSAAVDACLQDPARVADTHL
jgi:hypothetical protein